MRRQVVVTILGMGLCLSSVQAATQVPTTATFAVSASVVAGCMVVGNPTQTTGIGLGTLNFGSQAAVNTATASTTVSVGSNGMAQLQCTTGVSVTMTIDAGQNAQGSQRRMKLAPNYYLPYNLYGSAGTGSPIAPNVGWTITSNGSAWTVPVWGIATPPGTGLPPGQYSDTLQVTFSW